MGQAYSGRDMLAPMIRLALIAALAALVIPANASAHTWKYSTTYGPLLAGEMAGHYGTKAIYDHRGFYDVNAHVHNHRGVYHVYVDRYVFVAGHRTPPEASVVATYPVNT